MTVQHQQYTTKSDLAYGRVREAILAGELAPGAILPQSEIAHELGVSTTPLREALRRLMSEGLVQLDAHRNATISPLSAEEARDLLEIRLSLDPLAAALAAERRTKEDVAHMRECFASNRPLEDDPTVDDLRTHRAFHQSVYMASHNDLLISALNGLWDKADRYRRMALTMSRGQAERDAKAAEHRRLLDAVIRGDSDEAAETMRVHISTSLGARATGLLGAEDGDSGQAASPPGGITGESH